MVERVERIGFGIGDIFPQILPEAFHTPGAVAVAVVGVVKVEPIQLDGVETELNKFYNIYPNRFNNKTNGITFRRWLTQSNPALYEYIVSLIGDEFIILN